MPGLTLADLQRLIGAPAPSHVSAETTKLSPADEHRFRVWALVNNIPDVDSPDSFYDYRGFWKQAGNVPIVFGVDHFPDTFKQHGHPTFSVESKYSRGPADGGQWLTDDTQMAAPLASHGLTLGQLSGFKK